MDKNVSVLLRKLKLLGLITSGRTCGVRTLPMPIMPQYNHDNCVEPSSSNDLLESLDWLVPPVNSQGRASHGHEDNADSGGDCHHGVREVLLCQHKAQGGALHPCTQSLESSPLLDSQSDGEQA